MDGKCFGALPDPPGCALDTPGKQLSDPLAVGDAIQQMNDRLKVTELDLAAGAIAGPIVELDVRTLYLKDLSFFGCTFQEDIVFENLIRYIEHGEIRPVVEKTYPLKDIVIAQKDFLKKKFTGKLVLIPSRA